MEISRKDLATSWETISAAHLIKCALAPPRLTTCRLPMKILYQWPTTGRSKIFSKFIFCFLKPSTVRIIYIKYFLFLMYLTFIKSGPVGTIRKITRLSYYGVYPIFHGHQLYNNIIRTVYSIKKNCTFITTVSAYRYSVISETTKPRPSHISYRIGMSPHVRGSVCGSVEYQQTF